MVEINEADLSFADRLGLAYCRLNCCVWDEILGPKPDRFDELPTFSSKRLFRKRQPGKSDYTIPAMRAILSIIGDANVSRCWWIFVLGRSKEDWLQWYLSDSITKKDS